TTACITSDQAEPTSGDNSATVSVVIQPVVDLAVSIVANPSPVAVGQDPVYTVDVINRGPDEASAVTLANVLPAGVAFISASSNAGSPPTLSAGTVTAAVGALASGSVATLLITVQPTSSPGSILVDTASVSESSADFDPNPADTASISVPVRDVSNLVLTMTPSVPSVPIGQTLSYSMTVSNPGPADEPDATLTVPLPPDVNLVFRFIHARIGPCSRPGDGLGRSRCSRIRKSGNRHADHLTASIGPRAADDVGLGPGLQRRYRARAGRGFGHGDRRRRGGPVDRHYAPVRPRTPRAGLDLHADGRQRRPFRRHQRGRDFTSAAGDRACLCVLQPAGTADSAARRYLRSARNHRRRPVGHGHDRRPAVPAGARPRGTAHERRGFGRRF